MYRENLKTIFFEGSVFYKFYCLTTHLLKGSFKMYAIHVMKAKHVEFMHV